jgi:hypothetical protein
MNQYTVKYEIYVEAETPEEAAKLAMQFKNSADEAPHEFVHLTVTDDYTRVETYHDVTVPAPTV